MKSIRTDTLQLLISQDNDVDNGLMVLHPLHLFLFVTTVQMILLMKTYGNEKDYLQLELIICSILYVVLVYCEILK